MPWDWHEALFAKGRELDIAVFSSPFDDHAVDLLEALGTPAYKIASFELVDSGLIRKAAATGKPLIMSTGMANLDEIGEAMTAAREAGCADIMLLHCISAYPVPLEDSNLRVIEDLRRRFGVMVGLSDHSMGTAVAAAAVALGAPFIEKHFTLDRGDGGPDSTFSLEPAELKELVSNCRRAWRALGGVCYAPSAGEADNVIFRRSLYVVEDISAGDRVSEHNVRSIRPGYGLAPKHLSKVIGRRAKRNLSRGTALTWADLESIAEGEA
jgi:N-acetylneuraminate synthase